jgi:putative two-component system response regulator
MTTRILIVDDDEMFRRLVAHALRHEYAVEQAASGELALGMFDTFAPELVLLDIMMPGIDGYETCRRIKTTPTGAQTQIIMVSGHSSREEQLRAYELGADDYLVKPIDIQDLRARVQLHLRMRDALQSVFSIRQEITARNREIQRLAEQRAEDALRIQDVAICTLAKVAESRDQGTGAHVLRVRAYCQLLAEELRREVPYRDQIDAQFLEDIYRASPLHDIGKVGIPDAILLKPGRLTADEFERMKQHTVIGANILEQAIAQSAYASFLRMAAVVAFYHHERFDGSGYPAGLSGMEIPLPARILALADVYDALTTERPYKPAMPVSRAREMIQGERGRHFDPVIVDAFESRFVDFLQVGKAHTEERALAVGALSFREYELEMAVVVQRQIEPEAAGVAFSVDPVTGSPSRIVIESCPGLGEALVSGQV